MGCASQETTNGKIKVQGLKVKPVGVLFNEGPTEGGSVKSCLIRTKNAFTGPQ